MSTPYVTCYITPLSFKVDISYSVYFNINSIKFGREKIHTGHNLIIVCSKIRKLTFGILINIGYTILSYD